MAANSAKRRQRRKRNGVIAAVVAVVVLGLAGYWLAAALTLLLLYLVNELLLADHVFYSAAADYNYRIEGTQLAHRWQAGALEVDDCSRKDIGDTLLLEVGLAASPLGRWFDPRVRIEVGGSYWRQYLERGVAGRRYLNLSAAAAALRAGDSVKLTAEYCVIKPANSVLLGFENAALASSTGLVLAPHADDAEIAAFGYYSQAADCTLVTVTAGETETAQFAAWVDDDLAASRFKGEVRSLDSVAAGLWGGLDQAQCINLGYGCMQLEAMHQQPTEAVVSSWSGLADTRPFRRFNRVALPSDGDGGTSWGNLVADLSAILLARRPQVLVCPHPQLDTHSDHRYATLALWQACQATAIPPPVWLLYANHLDASQDFPFGPAHSAIGLPPAVLEEVAIQGLYNVELDADSRRRKALALDLMHDLKRPLRWKKWWRKRLQRVFLGRPLSPYGEDDFFRKAVRRSELFIVADSHQVERLLRRP